MIDYTWQYGATDSEIESAKAEAVNLVNATADAQQEMQVVLQAFEALQSKHEADVVFGREVFRVFFESY